MLLAETPDIYTDCKDILRVCPTGVFIGKKSGVYVSLYPRNTDATFVGVISGVLSLVYLEKVDYATLVTKADQTAVSTEHVAHFFDATHIQLIPPQR